MLCLRPSFQALRAIDAPNNVVFAQSGNEKRSVARCIESRKFSILGIGNFEISCLVSMFGTLWGGSQGLRDRQKKLSPQQHRQLGRLNHRPGSRNSRSNWRQLQQQSQSTHVFPANIDKQTRSALQQCTHPVHFAPTERARRDYVDIGRISRAVGVCCCPTCACFAGGSGGLGRGGGRRGWGGSSLRPPPAMR